MKVILPDGNQLDVPAEATARDAAKQIGEKLAEAAIGARVNGELVDADRPLVDAAAEAASATDAPPESVELSIITAPRLDKKGRSKFRDDAHQADALYLLRHSCAHVMAEAIERLWPETQLAYGPPLDNGFYYDIKLDTPISSDDFAKIETEMGKIIEADRRFMRYDLGLKEGFAKLDAEANKYKKDNAERASAGGARRLSWYVTGQPAVLADSSDNTRAYLRIEGVGPVESSALRGMSLSVPSERVVPRGIERVDDGDEQPWNRRMRVWEDLCQGPHVDRTGRIGAFKVMSIASSHWHGDVSSDRFQRVYGTAFFTEADLEAHLDLLEQAKARDHRVLGQKLGLFAIDEMVGQGLVLWKPNGAVVRDELQKFISKHLTRQGYSQVFTPHIGKLDLYKTSGHFPYYQDSQYPPIVERDTIKALADEGCSCGELSNRMTAGDIDGYMLKPMNCPHHIRIYASEKRSYRDLPIRLAEFGTVYRWEQSGELGGLTRVRGFTQDDAHLFVTDEQLADEVLGCIELVKIIFEVLGMHDYRVRVGLRDPDSSKFVGKAEDWDAAEAACEAAARSLGVPYSAEPGEAAFYGPKIDFVVKDVIGREWQLGTVQVDYQLPQRFDLSYVGSDNAEHRPVMIHRAPFGSMERFVGVLIEHFNGAFPLWLSPEQVRVLPISDKFNDYANKVAEAASAAGLRTTIDSSNDRLNAKIKAAQEMKVPYMLVVGGKDADAGTVSVRARESDRGDLGAIPLDAFVEQAKAEVDTFGKQMIGG